MKKASENNNLQNYRFLLSGGGTGGHIFPAVAIANLLKEKFPNASFLFVGAKDKMEMQKIPQAGYQIKGLWISGIQRKLTLQNAIFPFKLVSSLLNSLRIIKKFKPNVVIGTGGFASGAVLRMAQFLNIPTLIQEQNSYPGITNKVLAKRANAICVAYEDALKYFPKEKSKLTGNPIRNDIEITNEKRSLATSYFNLDNNKKTLLVIGGSLGARKINELIESQLQFFAQLNIQILWQCGSLYIEDYKKYNNNEGVVVLPFIDRMDLAYNISDFIISRSGASSVSELCVVGKPVVFIPSPNVAEDHQTKNAQAIANAKGALLIKEQELNQKFQSMFNELFLNEDLQKKLSHNIKNLALPNATKDIVEEINKLISNKL